MEKEATPNSGKRVVGHPPHKHKETEMIFLIGMDPNDPFELGAEVKLSIGDDMKEYAITRSCAIRIPPETPHGFYSITYCKTPFMFVSVQEANPPTEKVLWEYLTEEELNELGEEGRAFWKDKGYDE